ncbi:MAG: hypothetical protein EOP48_02380 [Sphingobacteriales bacterium]|nr:MAG: hypothetical protein EOP48_02380 [Sphingobacteriales bacterium]
MATNLILTSILGAVQINTANANMDGSGTVASIISGVGTNGSILTSITVKATGSTTPGMVRIFLQDPEEHRFLFEEFPIPANDINMSYGVIESFSSTLTFPMGAFKLGPSWALLASTQNAEQFNVIIEGYNQSYCPCE